MDKKTGLTVKEALLVHNYSEVKYEIPAAKAEAAAPQGSVTM
ncbi:hypothetical protein [Paenibacillus donghaensis]|nr:hypothetical protein [Paenibacillus donghaensis]